MEFLIVRGPSIFHLLCRKPTRDTLRSKDKMCPVVSSPSSIFPLNEFYSASSSVWSTGPPMSRPSPTKLTFTLPFGDFQN